MKRTHLLTIAGALTIVFVIVGLIRQRRVIALTSPACVGNINSGVYSTNGIVSTDFSSITALEFPSAPSRGSARLNTNLTPLDTNNIKLPFDQRVKVKYVYRNAGAQHSLGWFYFDNLGAPGASPGFVKADNTLADVDNDGIYDWFQDAGGSRPWSGLWKKASDGKVICFNGTHDDGGTWGSIPNRLETFMTTGGGWLFKICDDDGGQGKNYSWMIQNDVSDAADGIADYDVNGDGTIGNEPDRTVDLGIIQGQRELVLFALTYYGQNLPNAGLGTATTGSTSGDMTPLFSKNMLNPDIATATANSVLRKLAIGCQRDDSSCYSPKGGDLGWLDSGTITRLNTATYNNISLAGNTVVTINASNIGQVPHFVVAPPSNDPNRWIVGLEDLAGGGDKDWNDVVFTIEKSNGGEVISNEIANIPAAQQTDTLIDKIHVTAAFSFPAPGCNAPVTSSVNIYYSVDNKTTWRQVPFGSATGGDVVVDVLANHDVGSTLYWKAQIQSSSDQCQPQIDSFNLAWEAIKHGQYKYNAPIPSGNVIYSGTLETPAKTWVVTNNDYSLRGHFVATRLYDPNNLSADGTLALWDAGLQLQSISPDERTIFTSVNGAKTALTTANGASLYPLLLPSSVRAELLNGQPVFDFDSDGDSDDNDAALLLQWVRGWELGVANTVRAWKLGPIHYSSAAIVGPPANPAWYDGSGGPASLKLTYNLFRTANKTRRTLAVVGSQDGMVHAFDAGAFRWGADTACTVKLERGCFADQAGGGGPDYGSGAEVWAYAPPSQLKNFKSNPPKARSFIPDTYSDAEVDGGVSAEDILVGSNFVTGMFISLGRKQPYVTALQLPTNSTVASPMWANDFSDADFNGTDFSPAVALAQLGNATKFIAVVTSGLSISARTPYLFILDAATGVPVTNGKIRLTAPLDADTLGLAGYPNLIDADGDGVVDRVYAADTSGRVFKVDLQSMTRCQIATIGESVFTGMATDTTAGSSTPKVRLFVGGSPNPDGTANPPLLSAYHVFALEDADAVGTCTNQNLASPPLFSKALVSGEKLWATPYVAGNNVFFASSGASSLGVCDVGSGTLYGYDDDEANATQPIQTVSSVNLLGSPVSSIRIYDAHVFVNTVGGNTVQVGASGWNNTNSLSTSAGISTLKTLLWQEQ